MKVYRTFFIDTIQGLNFSNHRKKLFVENTTSKSMDLLISYGKDKIKIEIGAKQTIIANVHSKIILVNVEPTNIDWSSKNIPEKSEKTLTLIGYSLWRYFNECCLSGEYN